jgi:uncharacterized membrane protein YqjE
MDATDHTIINILSFLLIFAVLECGGILLLSIRIALFISRIEKLESDRQGKETDHVNH